MTTATSFPLRRRFWPKSLGRKALVVFVSAIILLVVLWLIALFVTQRRLDRAVSEAESLGFKDSWDDLAGPLIPESENAAVALLEAGLLASEVEDKLVAENPGRASLEGSKELSDAAAKLATNPAYERWLHEADVRASYRTTMRSEDPFRKGRSRSAPDHFSSVSIMENVCVEQMIRMGRRVEAVRRILRWLRITRKFGQREPWDYASVFTSGSRQQHSTTLNRILREGSLPTSLYDEIEREGASHDRSACYAFMAVNGLRSADLEILAWASVYHRWLLFRPLANIDSAYMHRSVNDFLEWAREPRQSRFRNLVRDHPLQGFPGGNRPSQLSATVPRRLVRLKEFFDTSVAMMRCLRIVNAMAKKGDFNASLDSLGLPPDCLVDPFDERPIRKKRTPDGPIIYSVGPDLADDEGQFEWRRGKTSDIGLGPLPKETKK